MIVKPEALRAATGVAIFPESDRPILADALEISDSSALADIECHCVWTKGLGDDHWYETDPATLEDIEVPVVEQAVRYLNSRGLLLRHSNHTTWVRFVEVPE